AVYDAINAIDRSHTPVFADVKAPRGAALEAAAAQAAHDTLAALFPAQRATFDATLAADLAGIPPGRARLRGAVRPAVARPSPAGGGPHGGPDRPAPHRPGGGPGLRTTPPPPHPHPAAGRVAGPAARGAAVGDGPAVLYSGRLRVPPAAAAGPDQRRVHGRLQ